MGDRAFVSTYENRDPLFAIDLSNPNEPVVAGMLQMPGYTDYLQPIDPTHLIGIGEEVDPLTGEASDFEVSLFDVSDLNNPVLVNQYIVSANDWSWSQANYDYHAITYYPQLQALALPVSGDGWAATTDGLGSQWVYQSDLLVFHLDPSSGTLSLLGQVSDVSDINRSVFIGNMLYAISDTSVQVESLDDLGTVVAQVQLPAPSYPDWGWIGPIYPIIIAVPLPVFIVPFTIVSTGDLTNNVSTPAAPEGNVPAPNVTKLPETVVVTPRAATSGKQATDSRSVSNNLPETTFASLSTALDYALTSLEIPQFSAPASEPSSAPITPTVSTAGVPNVPVNTAYPVGPQPQPVGVPLDSDRSDPSAPQEMEKAPVFFDGFGLRPADTWAAAVSSAVFTALRFEEFRGDLNEPVQGIRTRDRQALLLDEVFISQPEEEVSPLWVWAVVGLLPVADRMTSGRKRGEWF